MPAGVGAPLGRHVGNAVRLRARPKRVLPVGLQPDGRVRLARGAHPQVRDEPGAHARLQCCVQAVVEDVLACVRVVYGSFRLDASLGGLGPPLAPLIVKKYSTGPGCIMSRSCE